VSRLGCRRRAHALVINSALVSGPCVNGATRTRRIPQATHPPSRVPERITAGFEPVSPDSEPDHAERPIPAGWLSIFRPRLYLLDEPEQRLHPALQRRAARWLVDRMHEWRSQCIVVTHSTAFMDLPGDSTVYELTHAGSMAAIRRLNLAELTPHAQFARELGLDRGELLSRWRAFLFVEGLADAAVIEELFDERLEESRIRVLPVHGHRSHTGLLDMMVLADGTATPIAALIDSVSQGDIQEIRAAPSWERAKMMQRPDETGTVAKIVELANKRERDIEILTIEAPDIFDLLDGGVIKRMTARSGGSSFPGHQAAREAFALMGGPNAPAPTNSSCETDTASAPRPDTPRNRAGDPAAGSRSSGTTREGDRGGGATGAYG
jgi:AAA domain, putative AbiEii toxin, Type IV TA system